MKEGWTYKKLGEVCEVISGQSPDGKSYNNEGKGTPFYQGKKEFTIKYIGNPTTWTSEETKIAMKDDILMSVRAPVGDINFATQRVCIGRGLAAVRPNTLIDKDYLFYFLLSEKNNIKGKEGAVFPSINRKEIMDISISYPIFSEQQRIVSRLDSAFAHIEELKANAEKKLSEARALFQKALAKAMEPKEGWEEKKLKEIAQVRIGPFGSLLHKKDYISDGIPLVNPIHMIEGKIVANNDYTISEEKAKELSAYLLRTNDVIFARRGEIGRCAIVSSNEDGFLCGTGSLFVRFKAKVDNAFMQMLFQSEVCKNYLLKSASGATMLNINAGIVEEMPLTIPPLSEQQRIVTRLDSLSAHVRELEEVLQKTIAECDALKQALLRQVFE
ncbi:restriction endonuclease subunit S [Prevotella communis]|uniref:restriction endonuclease subunit S n=1 Tax=Prevotella communis TaxID=2913614 RepID=UPI001EDBAB84|nr:restriction endonuclease subunit S [Prevotella communis]UKK56029.1 restriction endonuclease subunit S [Prevotella communis]UKK58545.1 restriction endonuclease subunit S [Prevotella communis]UKK61588.1 restriction endonuclease subunit S [Prevotella communis]UKK64414.1 restriction endonuclease subunit S [Prevotella communis]